MPVPAVESAAPSPGQVFRAQLARRLRRERWTNGVIRCAAVAVLAAVAGIPTFLLVDAGVSSASWAALRPVFVGSLKAAFAAMVVALPLGLFAAAWCARFASPATRAWLKPVFELIEAVPAVVLGLVASVTVAPWLARHVVSVAAFAALLPVALGAVGLAWPSAPAGWRRRATGYEPWLCVPVIAGVALAAWLIGSGITHALGVGEPATPWNLLLVGIVLGLAVMPMLFTLAEDALFAVPAHLTDGALALGASRWQALVRLVVPAAAPGLFAAVLLCLSRALGETMIVLMASGNTPDATGNPFVGLRAISANLALEAPEAVPGSAHYRLLLTSALLLFVLCFILNSVADAVRVRLRRRLAGL
ncbi:ABC transporter permease subunit [Tahibacter amnicola]|uniref:ABC transporter permease subunit n=1 Tax=Tahibacter amnicola TaxID=2976241 RepID=A0ABY6BII7_9GAMM|nr:ABC transporter permease subunit [Tahibacter amnicola]UXI69572.1 ABC transporter permease subunit [Tahibacter amnicola]